MTILQAALIAAYYGFFASQPLILLMGPSNFGAIIGLIVGAILGDASTGVMFGAWIQVTMLGVVNYGGTKPVDQFAACIIAIPIAIAADLPVGIAIVLASLFGAVSFPIDNLWKKINTEYLTPRIDNAIVNGNYGAITRLSGLWPMLIRFFLSGIPAFLLLMLGMPLMELFMHYCPIGLRSGLSSAGMLLPALGTALFLCKIGRPKLLPFFIAGYFAALCFELPILAVASFSVLLAVLYDREMERSEAENRTPPAKPVSPPMANDSARRVPKTLLWRCELKLAFLHMTCQTNDRGYVNAFTAAMLPILKYLWNGTEDAEAHIREGLERTRSYYLCEQSFSTVAFSIIAGMEEKLRNREIPTATMIPATRSAIMGPMSGLGDTLHGSTSRQIAIGLTLPLCIKGSVASAIAMLLLMNITPWATVIYGVPRGYAQGAPFILGLVRSGKLQRFAALASPAIAFIIGIGAATWLMPACMCIPDLNIALPGLLGLICIGVYALLIRKKVSINKQMLATLLLCVLIFGLQGFF